VCVCVTVGRRSGAVCVCVNACFSLTPSDAASGVTRRCCSLLRAQVAQSIAKVQWNGRQLCQCMPYCCCRRLGVDVKRHRVRSLGVDYKSLGKHRWTRIYCKRYDIACYNYRSSALLLSLVSPWPPPPPTLSPL